MRVTHGRQRLRGIGAALIVGIMAGAIGVPAAAFATDPGLVAQWTFDEGSGTSAIDSVGDADGTVSGAAWLTSGAAVGSGALRFDGTSSVDVASSAVLQPGTVTLAAWVRGDPADPPTAGEIIAEKGAFGCAGPEYGLYVTADGIGGRYRSRSGNDLSGSISETTAHVDLWDGGWHLVALAIANDYAGAEISIDAWTAAVPAEWQYGQTGAIAYTGATEQDLRIGAPVHSGCTSAGFTGDIDDVRVYSTYLDYQSLLDLIPKTATTTTIDPHGTFPMWSDAPFGVTISPTPRRGSLALSFRDHTTGAIVVEGVIQLGGEGHVTANIGSPSYAGTFDLVATFSGWTYQPSTDTDVVEIAPLPSSTSLALTPSSPIIEQPISLSATVTYESIWYGDYATGSVEFIATSAGVDHSLGSVALTPYSAGVSKATLAVPSGLGLGSWTLVAHHSGDLRRAPSDSLPLTLAISTATASVSLDGPASTQAHHPVLLFPNIQAGSSDWATGGTVSVGPVSGTGLSCVMPVSPSNTEPCTLNGLAVGTYSYRATYSGNATVSGGTSAPLTFAVTPDTIEASSVGVGYTTFYPIKDGYRDTVAISGVRNEPASASIKIYAPSGKRVKSTSVGLGSGKYSFTWTGRTSTGSVLPSGKYKVLQRLTDGAGTTKLFTSYVNLSGKRIYTYTAYVNRSIAQATSKSSSSISWDFTIPSATVYKGLAFQVYGRSVTVPGGEFGAYDTRPCDGESGPGCIQKWVGLGWTTKWYSDSLSPTYNRVGRHVYGTVVAYGTAVVYKARVKVIYGLLR